MASVYGKKIKVSIFGQSHSPAIGVTVDGLPAGFPIDMEALGTFLARRAPGKDKLSTPRKEADLPEFLSGLRDGVTCGAPLAAIIHNTNTRSGDYNNLHDCPRPGHADFPAAVKWDGHQDPAGGGHFSGRLTAPLCIAGGIALQMLRQKNIFIGAHIAQVGKVFDTSFDPINPDPALFDLLGGKSFPTIDDKAGEQMQAEILAVREEQDSIGGVIECAVTGLPVGLGDPMFEGMENRIASIVFGIPAVKGLEFGAGFACAAMRGSQCNDPYCIENGEIRTTTNNNGGILGGITNGMPLIFRAAVKPTSSISREQNSVSISRKEEQKLVVHGRHDPCIVHRAVPVVEAAAALAVLDALLDQ